MPDQPIRAQVAVPSRKGTRDPLNGRAASAEVSTVSGVDEFPRFKLTWTAADGSTGENQHLYVSRAAAIETGKLVASGALYRDYNNEFPEWVVEEWSRLADIAAAQEETPKKKSTPRVEGKKKVDGRSARRIDRDALLASSKADPMKTAADLAAEFSCNPATIYSILGELGHSLAHPGKRKRPAESTPESTPLAPVDHAVIVSMLREDDTLTAQEVAEVSGHPLRSIIPIVSEFRRAQR